jgi:Flp pilus assembly pilin Flp
VQCLGFGVNSFGGGSKVPLMEAVLNSLFCRGYKVISLKEFLHDEQGAEIAEYAVACAILVAIAIVVYQVLGDAVNNKMNDVADEIDPPAPPP